jgi:hypothetical protein
MPSVTERASAVRSEFADFLDDARLRPKYIKRRKMQYVMMSSDEFDRMLHRDNIDVKLIKDDNGEYYTESHALPMIIGFGATEDDALRSFEGDTVSFAYEYYSNYPLYSASPNTADKAVIVTKVISHYERYGNISGILKVC